MPLKDRIPVAVLGATGSVGQRMVTLLERHPWFRLGSVTASERSVGRLFQEAANWVLPTPIPEEVAGMQVYSTGPELEERLLFSALDASVAGSVETEYAERGHVVVSNARNHRMDPDVPLLVPEVNPDHLDLVARQSFGGGAIIANPNCSTIGMALALAPLHRAFGVERVNVVTLQAISGAGIPGVSSLQIIDNIIPYISGEEEKLETEPLKILGELADGVVAPAPVTVSAQCNRVPVVDGHTLCISVELGRTVSAEAIIDVWDSFRSEPHALGLPSAPSRPVVYLDEPDQPQPRMHRDLGNGMAVAVGRLRPCPLLGWKFVTTSHNTVRGAAGGALLCAELAVARRAVEGFRDFESGVSDS
jgi:aspartate-semialdehyde dehydrogenase